MIYAVEKEKCTGCKACGDVCPTGAIRFDTDMEGFWYPKVDENRCIKCKNASIHVRHCYYHVTRRSAHMQHGIEMMKRVGAVRLAECMRYWPGLCLNRDIAWQLANTTMTFVARITRLEIRKMI